MYLKKLELNGFKSFPDKAEFQFGPGVTGIVGPNGCGKSNVVDAFKWIFGDQSAKSLRGLEMKDVIFNGTQSRKPSGFAEVTVVFDNTDRFFNIEFSEVALTRRLFRSGESEYLINRQRCRLKDIKELVMDTGIGTTSYSILEQGKIDVLLQANTLDRRIIFEEAAGISKYRVRKSETLRALQRVEENLARAGDLIAELEKQLHRVKAQAGKAKKYREHADRLRELRIRLAWQDFSTSVLERQEISFHRCYLDFQIARLEDLSRRLRQGLESSVQERHARGASLQDLRDRLAETRMKRERTEERLVLNRRRLEELQVELFRKEEAQREAVPAVANARAELEREGQEVQRVALELEERRRILSAVSSQLEDSRRECEERRDEVEGLKGRLVSRLEERSRLGNDLVQIDSEITGLNGRKARLDSQIQQAQAELCENLAKAAAVQKDLEAVKLGAEGLEGLRLEAQDEVARLEQEIATAGDRLERLNGRIQGDRSRLEVLHKFEENYEGVAQGVARILRDRREQFGVRDLLARLIQVESEYALAVEGALGAHAQSLVVQSQEGALQLLQHARETRIGALEVLPLDRVAIPELEAFLPEEGVIGLLREKVSAGAGCQALLDCLLARVVLVKDLDTALALSRNGPRFYRLVTLAGEVVEPWGALAVSGEKTTGLISRRSEMRDLERELSRLEEEARSFQTAVQELERARLDKTACLQDLGRQRELKMLQLAALESQIQQLDKDKERFDRTARITASELDEVALDLAARAAEKGRVEAKILGLEAEKKAIEEELRKSEERSAQKSDEAQRLSEAANETKVQVAAVEKREEGLRRAIQQLERSLSEWESRHRALAEEIGGIQGRIQETSGDLYQAQESLASLDVEQAAEERETGRAEEEDRRFAEIEDAFRQEIDRVRTLIGEKITGREKANLKEQEGVLKRNATLEKIRDEYGLDLLALVENPPGPALALQASGPQTGAPQAASGEIGPAPAPAPASPGHDWAQLLKAEPSWDRQAAAEEIQGLQEKIRRLGNVNLDALDELEEIEKRLTFQVSQRDDLQRAERDLRQIIAEINKTSRELFTATFEQVQKNFGELFEKCFGGGKAELMLEDSADILEAGIEIVARPPGKKLTSLSLMSGGEKTMTTIALLFAIFKSRPSPFCLLDEVDAALDETNVSRFVVLLESFKETSQFILITHNKITMATTDRLYGVTMQEKGVSKRVAVELEKYDPENPHASLSTADIDEAPVVEAAVEPPGG